MKLINVIWKCHHCNGHSKNIFCQNKHKCLLMKIAILFKQMNGRIVNTGVFALSILLLFHFGQAFCICLVCISCVLQNTLYWDMLGASVWNLVFGGHNNLMHCICVSLLIYCRDATILTAWHDLRKLSGSLYSSWY